MIGFPKHGEIRGDVPPVGHLSVDVSILSVRHQDALMAALCARGLHPVRLSAELGGCVVIPWSALPGELLQARDLVYSLVLESSTLVMTNT